MRLKIKNIGLAGYLKMMSDSGNGVSFIGYTDGLFVFESERDENAWRVEYVNSCCNKHDKCVMEMRDFARR